MIIYVDVIFVINTLLTSALLFAVGNFLEVEHRWWRIAAAACLGSFYTFLVLYIQYNLPQGRIIIILQIILNIAAAVLMVVTAFGRLNLMLYVKAVGYLYLLSFFAIGTGVSVFYLYGANPFQSRNVLFLLLVLVIIIISGKFGLRLVKRYISPEEGICRLLIEIEEREVSVEGLVDTGNRLQDPFSGVPVIVVEMEEILPLFAREIREKLLNWRGNVYELLSYLERKVSWKKRIRAIPFSDLGQEAGLLIGIRPDSVKFKTEDGDLREVVAVLGITDSKLDKEEQYSALINPELINKGGEM
ncbi:MAG: sigma-E processing peptidase SpoIIGA [Halanaerobiales bacterium]